MLNPINTEAYYLAFVEVLSSHLEFYRNLWLGNINEGLLTILQLKKIQDKKLRGI